MPLCAITGRKGSGKDTCCENLPREFFLDQVPNQSIVTKIVRDCLEPTSHPNIFSHIPQDDISHGFVEIIHHRLVIRQTLKIIGLILSELKADRSANLVHLLTTTIYSEIVCSKDEICESITKRFDTDVSVSIASHIVYFLQKSFSDVAGIIASDIANRICASIGASIDTQKKRIVLYSFAAPLKKSLEAVFDLSPEQTNDPVLKETIDPRYQKSPRELMQWFGTDCIRNQIDEHFWIKRFLDFYEKNKESIVIVTDLRFENEAKMIRDLGGKVVKIQRDLLDQRADSHVSETREIAHDFLLKNNHTKESLQREFSKIISCLVKAVPLAWKS